MRRRPVLIIHHVMAVGVGFALLTACKPDLATTQESQSRPPASEQIQTILDEKAGRTPAQQKISSHLLYALKKGRQGEARPGGAPTLRTAVKVEADGTTLVDIDAEVTKAVLASIEALGGTVINSFPQYQAIRARIPLRQVETLAQVSEITFIRPADEAMTHAADPASDRRLRTPVAPLSPTGGTPH